MTIFPTHSAIMPKFDAQHCVFAESVSRDQSVKSHIQAAQIPAHQRHEDRVVKETGALKSAPGWSFQVIK